MGARLSQDLFVFLDSRPLPLSRHRDRTGPGADGREEGRGQQRPPIYQSRDGFVGVVLDDLGPGHSKGGFESEGQDSSRGWELGSVSVYGGEKGERVLMRLLFGNMNQ